MARYVDGSSTDPKRFLHLGILVCTRCGEQKLVTQFNKNCRTSSGFAHACKDCARDDRKRVTADPNRKLSWHLKSLYGITLDEYREMLESQDGRCKICSKTAEELGEPRLSVDHDHETKVVRGLLCGNCNRGLGKFRDDPGLLRSAIQYLEESRAADCGR